MSEREMFDHDQKIFEGYLNLWGITSKEKKIIVLDNGIGDHWAFKNILPELKKKHKKIAIAACFPDVFFDEPEIELMSIADAKNMFAEIDNFNIYKWMWAQSDKGRKIHLVEAFREFYGS